MMICLLSSYESVFTTTRSPLKISRLQVQTFQPFTVCVRIAISWIQETASKNVHEQDRKAVLTCSYLLRGRLDDAEAGVRAEQQFRSA